MLVRGNLDSRRLATGLVQRMMYGRRRLTHSAYATGNLLWFSLQLRQLGIMDNFPEFMQHPANRIATIAQVTPGVEGYVFDGADGSQMAFWTCHQTALSAAHVHDYDEYMVVVHGCYTLIVDGQRIPLNAGDEYFICKGTRHGGEVVAGTRTIHCFGAHRADRIGR